MFLGKKLISFTLAVTILPSLALAMSPNAQGANTQNQGSTSGSATQSQATTETQTQAQTRTNNPGTGTMTQEQAQIQLRERIQECSPSYEPTSIQSQTRKGQVVEIIDSVVTAAEELEDQAKGNQIREIMRQQSESYDAINASFDKATKRSALVKFFIGPNYAEIKAMKQAMEQNRNQIREMEQIMAQISNEGDKIKLATQIITMQNLQLELQDQLGELTRGFSLFGWLNRWIRGY